MSPRYEGERTGCCAGQVAQRSEITAAQKTILHALDLPEPPKYFDFTLPDSR